MVYLAEVTDQLQPEDIVVVTSIRNDDLSASLSDPVGDMASQRTRNTEQGGHFARE